MQISYGARSSYRIVICMMKKQICHSRTLTDERNCCDSVSDYLCVFDTGSVAVCVFVKTPNESLTQEKRHHTAHTHLFCVSKNTSRNRCKTPTQHLVLIMIFVSVFAFNLTMHQRI